MEISGIDTVQTLKNVKPKDSVHGAAQLQDMVIISTEAQKRSEWIEQLKEMPDIRAEKIEASCNHPPISAKELAAHMMRSLL